MKKTTPYVFGIIITIIGAICWGFSGTCSEFLFKTRGISSEWLTTWRMIFAGIVLLSIAEIKGIGPKSRSIWYHRKDRKKLIIFSIFGLLSCQYTYLAAISHSNSGTATILQYISPVLTIIWACFAFRRKPNQIELISIFCVIIGVFLLSTHGNPYTLVLSLKGLIWGLASALAYSLATILPRELVKPWGSIIITGWAMLIGGIFFLIVSRPFYEVIHWDFGFIFGLFGLFFIGTVMSYSFFLYGVSVIGPVRASMIASVEPVSAALFSHFWLGTYFSFIDAIGFISILIAVILLSKPEASPNP